MTSLDLSVTDIIVRARTRDCLLGGTDNPPPTQQPDPLLGSAPWAWASQRGASTSQLGKIRSNRPQFLAQRSLGDTLRTREVVRSCRREHGSIATRAGKSGNLELLPQA